jgi:hypothetical protein
MTTWDQTARVERRRPRPAARPARSTRFKGGDNVWHTQYGEGIVVSSTFKGTEEEVEVLFPGGVGQKTILADFLKPMEG